MHIFYFFFFLIQSPICAHGVNTHHVFTDCVKRVRAGLLALLAAQSILSSICLLPNTQKSKTVESRKMVPDGPIRKAERETLMWGMWVWRQRVLVKGGWDELRGWD